MEGGMSITLEIGKEFTAADGLTIRYADFGHEHVSHGPGEPFAATTAMYLFQIADGAGKKTYTLFQDRNETTPPIRLEHHEIALVSVSGDQRVVTMKIIKI
jgi:hypothetical protein